MYLLSTHMAKVTSKGFFSALVAATLLMFPLFGGAAPGAPAATATATGPPSNCTRRCGYVDDIPYPFGIEPGCYHGAGFNLTCNHSYQPPALFLGDGTVVVFQIFPSNATVRINSTVIKEILMSSSGDDRTVVENMTLGFGFPYYVSDTTNNMLHVQGCNVMVLVQEDVQNDTLISSCTSVCSSPNDDTSMLSFPTECMGIGCCQTGVVGGYSRYNIQIQNLHNSFYSADVVSIYLVDRNALEVQQLFPEVLLQLATLDWVISTSICPANGSAPECLSARSNCSNSTALGHGGYICECIHGYQGNPYVLDGCQEAPPTCEYLRGDPCYGDCLNIGGYFYCQCPKGTYGDPFAKDGCYKINNSVPGLRIGLGFVGGICLLVLTLGAPFIFREIQLQKVKKMKDKFFKQNHGLLLQQLISQNAHIGERMILTLAELEKATNNFDRARVIGGGGHGLVFKGIIDLHVVAIKKSKIVVKREIDDFINEVAVLSQVNHRNVVKLLGCCLETEVPLLVYEFISNGTLYHHLHVEGPISLPWEDRIRIALEVARALSYLHSAASIPIFHRDIKSSNILLDDMFTAKVSDFGASRHIPIDKTGVTTAVQGTIGYLDPVYYYTGRLTDKSDVFSFGVLLVELLTRKKPYVYRSVDDDGLVSHFVSLHAKGNLVEIIDPQVIGEEGVEIREVATIATMCTKLKGEDRPTMKEVERTLENLLVKKKYSRKPMRHYANQTTVHYMPSDSNNKEASRQYTMEEEILLSASYPR